MPRRSAFTRSAKWYDLLYSFKDYQAAAAQLHAVIQTANPGARSLLDVACGTGRHLEHLRQWYEVEGVDLNGQFLRASRKRLPGIVLHHGDMTHFDLGRRFDVVTCLFSSIGYLQTVKHLRSAFRSFARHVVPGGLLVVEPWLSPDQYWLKKVTLNTVQHEGTTIAWMYTSKRSGRRSIFDIHFLVGTASGVEHFVETHAMGLFTPREYTEALRRAGFDWRHDPKGLFGRGMYTAVLR